MEANESRSLWISWIQTEECNLKSCSQLKFVVKGCRRKRMKAKGEAISQTAAFYFTQLWLQAETGQMVWWVYLRTSISAGRVSLLILMSWTLVFLFLPFLSSWPFRFLCFHSFSLFLSFRTILESESGEFVLNFQRVKGYLVSHKHNLISRNLSAIVPLIPLRQLIELNKEEVFRILSLWRRQEFE